MTIKSIDERVPLWGQSDSTTSLRLHYTWWAQVQFLALTCQIPLVMPGMIPKGRDRGNPENGQMWPSK